MLLETVLGQHYRWKEVGVTDIYKSQAVRTYAEWERTTLQWATSDGIVACPEAHLKVTLPKDGSSTPADMIFYAVQKRNSIVRRTSG